MRGIKLHGGIKQMKNLNRPIKFNAEYATVLDDNEDVFHLLIPAYTCIVSLQEFLNVLETNGF